MAVDGICFRENDGAMSSFTYDLAVVGGGIVGAATAWAAIRDYGASTIVLETESKLAAHQTGNNSGVIHSGLYYKPGSLKARLCVEGREELYRFCRDHAIAHDRCGKLVVAVDPSEVARLDELERRGHANGLVGIRRLAAKEIGEFEPHVRGVAALHIPETGIVDYVQTVETLARLARERGAEVCPARAFLGIRRESDGLIVETTQGEVRARALVACAGLQADRVARLCGVDPGVRIVPFRGEYYQLIPERESLVRNLIYPVPDPQFPFLGVHFTRMARGGVEAGPNAVFAWRRHGYRKLTVSPRDAWDALSYPGFWKMARKHWKTGCGEMWRSFSKRAFTRALARLIPELRSEDIVPAGAGVRAQALKPSGDLVDDFHLVTGDRMIHVLNAPSPAATASLAIGRTVAERAAGAFGWRRLPG